jgi:hypothetical protein
MHALEAWHGATASGTPDCPSHHVPVTIRSGASAGGITAGLTAGLLGEEFGDVTAAMPSGAPNHRRFTSGVDSIGLTSGSFPPSGEPPLSPARFLGPFPSRAGMDRPGAGSPPGFLGPRATGCAAGHYPRACPVRRTPRRPLAPEPTGRRPDPVPGPGLAPGTSRPGPPPRPRWGWPSRGTVSRPVPQRRYPRTIRPNLGRHVGAVHRHRGMIPRPLIPDPHGGPIRGRDRGRHLPRRDRPARPRERAVGLPVPDGAAWPPEPNRAVVPGMRLRTAALGKDPSLGTAPGRCRARPPSRTPPHPTVGLGNGSVRAGRLRRCGRGGTPAGRAGRWCRRRGRRGRPGRSGTAPRRGSQIQ